MPLVGMLLTSIKHGNTDMVPKLQTLQSYGFKGPWRTEMDAEKNLNVLIRGKDTMSKFSDLVAHITNLKKFQYSRSNIRCELSI